jgi:hypothetical protein
MPRSRAVFAIFFLLLAIGLPATAQTASAPAAAQSHSGAVTQEMRRHQAAVARETKRHMAALAHAEKRHQAAMARHQAALARLARKHQAAQAKHQAALARAEKKRQAALARHQAALARLAKKRQMALAKHQAALAKADKKQIVILAQDGKQQPAATTQASKAHPAATAQTPKKHHAAAHGDASFVKWVRQYYRNRDSGWAANDVSKLLARTTSDFQYIVDGNQVATRDQMIAEYSSLISSCIEKNAHMVEHTSVAAVSFSGNTAVVIYYIKFNANRHLETNEGDPATLNAKTSRERCRDTWVHLPEGWYLARAEESFNNTSVDLTGHLNE